MVVLAWGRCSSLMAGWSEEIRSLEHATPFISSSFGDESLMRRGRAADRGNAVKPEARQACPVALFGRAAAVVPLGPCGAVRFLGRKEGTTAEAEAEARHGQWAVCSGTGALPVSVLRVEQRVGVSPSTRSRSCFADTHTAWLVSQALS